MKSDELRVAITGFSGYDNPEPGIGVALALREAWKGPLQIDALGYDKWVCNAFATKAIDQAHLVPSFYEGEEAAFARLMELHKKRNYNCLLSNLELEISLYSRLQHRLLKHGIYTLLPPVEQIEKIQKENLSIFAHDHEIRIPKTLHVPNLKDLDDSLSHFTFPVMVKGSVVGAKLAYDPKMAKDIADKFNKKWGGGIILQQFIPGEDIVAAIVANRDGLSYEMVAMRKLAVTSIGKGAIGAIYEDKILYKEIDKILKALYWRGPLELEFVRAYDLNKYYLIEINPRFPAWILLSHFAGKNLPLYLVQEALQMRTKPHWPVKLGAMYVRDFEEATLTSSELIQFYQGVGSIKNTEKKGSAPPKEKKQKEYSVAITGISTFDQVYPGTGVGRCLQATPDVGQVLGFGKEVYDSGLYRSDIIQKGYLLSDLNDPSKLLEQIIKIKKKNNLDFIFPNTNLEISSIVSIKNRLLEIGVHTFLPEKEAVDRVIKNELFLHSFQPDFTNFQLAKMTVVTSLESLKAYAQKLEFPLIIRGFDEMSSTSMLMHKKNDLTLVWEQLEREGFDKALVQKFVVGNEYAITGICDKKHNVVGEIAIKKLAPLDLGKLWTASSVKRPELSLALSTIAKKLQWIGPIELIFVQDELTEKLILFEIIPRFPSWIGFGVDLGCNLPGQLIRMAQGKSIDNCSYEVGKIYCRSLRDFPITTSEIAEIFVKKELVHHG